MGGVSDADPNHPPPGAGLGEGASIATPTLRVLCRSLAQLEAAAQFGIANLIVDFQDIREYRAAVETATAHTRATIYLATPRIQKPDEMGIFHALAKHGASGILVRNLAGLAFCPEQRHPVRRDFSLNAANEWTVDYLRSRGAERVTASYDLNRDQLLDLVAAVPPAWLEVVVHQHMPMFHMEHCVFCAVLSPGTNKTNCGRPCDVHDVKLRDRIGMEHVLHGRRRLPQHALQRRAAKRGRSRAEAARPRPARLPHRAACREPTTRPAASSRSTATCSPAASPASKSGSASAPPTASASPAARSKNAATRWRFCEGWTYARLPLPTRCKPLHVQRRLFLRRRRRLFRFARWLPHLPHFLQQILDLPMNTLRL